MFADGYVTLLDVVFGLLKQPLSQVVVNLVHLLLQICWRNLLEKLAAALAVLNAVKQPSRQLVGVGLDQPHQPPTLHTQQCSAL